MCEGGLNIYIYEYVECIANQQSISMAQATVQLLKKHQSHVKASKSREDSEVHSVDSQISHFKHIHNTDDIEYIFLLWHVSSHHIHSSFFNNIVGRSLVPRSISPMPWSSVLP